MSHNRHRDSLRTRAPRCCRSGKSSSHVRAGSGVFVPSVLGGPRGRDSRKRSRVAQSISRGTFDNALCTLKPGCEFVGACLLPALGYGSKPPLFSAALEAEPAAAVLARDLEVSPKRVPSPLGRDSPLGSAFVHGSTYRHRSAGRGAAINTASFGGGWSHQPHFPPFAFRVDKGPITHPPPPPRFARQGPS
jgi:hypothetical protein